MFRLILLLYTAIIVSSCHNPTGIKEIIASSDSAAINFFKGDGSMDTVVKVIIIKDKKQVGQLAAFIESGTIKNQQCGYDGSLYFFKNNRVSQNIDFRTTDIHCMHFSFRLEGKLYTTALSNEAKEFFESLKK